ncbi:MAG: hypothetical protein QMD04_08785 [Anaerolineales bacterium]|nr:hypothetical protein [Anaerolineales bacterium]
MKRIFFCAAIIFALGLFGCAPGEGAIQTAIAQTAVKEIESDLPTETQQPKITNTLRPTRTATIQPPTRTQAPTKTPTNTSTVTPIPEPVVYSGTGNKILDIDDYLVGKPRVIDITYKGSGNFAVISYDANNNYLDLLVNTIGNYSGRVPIDWADDETATRFEIKGSGDWEFVFYPISRLYQHVAEAPTTYQGTGDDVVILLGNPDVGKIKCETRGNLVVWVISINGRDLLVNEIAPYEGEFLFPSGSAVIFVNAPGEWSITMTARK